MRISQSSRATSGSRSARKSSTNGHDPGGQHALEEAAIEPPAAFARGAVIFTDAGGLAVEPSALEDLRGLLGGAARVLARRVGG